MAAGLAPGRSNRAALPLTDAFQPVPLATKCWTPSVSASAVASFFVSPATCNACTVGAAPVGSGIEGLAGSAGAAVSAAGGGVLSHGMRKSPWPPQAASASGKASMARRAFITEICPVCVVLQPALARHPAQDKRAAAASGPGGADLPVNNSGH